jgi:phosphate butyryltransferase
MELKKLDDLIKIAKQKGKKKLVVAAAEDQHVLEAVRDAVNLGIIEPVLVGDQVKIKEIAKKIDFDISKTEIHNETDPNQASKNAVYLINEGKGDILMKGLVGTSGLLKPVLHKETGLRKSEVLSHVAIFETPFYHKLLGMSDVAMNIAPELKEKVAIINNAVEVFNKLGMERPKVALLGAVEVVNPAMPSTLDSAALSVMNIRGQIKNCVIDGPLALDNAISKEAAEIKKIESEVAGDADILICPAIEAGNVLYKSLAFLGGATLAAVIMGARVPIVLTSRADSERNKLMSIALAAAL